MDDYNDSFGYNTDDCCMETYSSFLPFHTKTIELKINGEVTHNWRTVVVGVTIITTILLWIFGSQLFGINANTTAMLPIAVFALTGVITAKDFKK
jgi:sodium-dependent dicarboxylate transporter 2/3/5